MVSKFEDHCWQDIVDPKILDIYSAYDRETYVGNRPALLAIDLYQLAYQGGAKPVHDLMGEFPSSCGENAWNAIEPTQRLFKAARAVGIPISIRQPKPARKPMSARPMPPRDKTSPNQTMSGRSRKSSRRRKAI